MFRLRIRTQHGTIPALPADLARYPTWRDESGRVFAFGETRGDARWLHMPGVASYRLSGEGSIIEASPHSGATEAAVRAAYTKTALPIAAHVRGLEVLHASAAMIDQQVVAFCGPSGSGKSTIGYALREHGYPLWADDALVCELGEAGPVAQRLPFEVRLRGPSARHFGRAKDEPPLLLCQRRGGKEPERARLGAIFSLQSGADRVTATRMSAAAAFTSLIPHAFYFDLGDDSRRKLMVRQYLVLARAVPIYELRYPRGMEQLPLIIESVVSLGSD